MDRKVLWLLASCSLLSAGNIYYAQPLLGEMAQTFAVSPKAIGMIPALSQAGYVGGLLFLSPLADVWDNKKFLITLLIFEALALAAFSLVPTFDFLALVSFLLGFSSILVQVALPLVAILSPKKERAKNLGIIISSALIGILISRATSGWLGGLSHWRVVYQVAAIVLLILSFFFMKMLPQQPPQSKMKYKELLLSLVNLYKDLPPLRSISLNGALLYAALSSFWATLAFDLSEQFHLGASAAGSFGFIGALGALAASQAGRLISRYGSTVTIRWCMATMALSFLIMGVEKSSLIGLIMGVIVLDVGAQAATVTNQSELYNLHSTAQARLNTIYKILYFMGGAVGTATSAFAWSHWKWPGVCAVGVFFVLLAFLQDLVFGLRTQ